MDDRRRVQRVGAYGLVFDDAGRLLLCRLSPEGEKGSRWTLPGGGIDFGEMPADGARREVFEETGLRVELGDVVMVSGEVADYPDAVFHHVWIVYAAKAVGGKLTPEVGGSTDLCAWFTAEELIDLPKVSLVEATLAAMAARRR